jgi:hypothetical protein
MAFLTGIDPFDGELSLHGIFTKNQMSLSALVPFEVILITNNEGMLHTQLSTVEFRLKMMPLGC